MKLTAQFSDAGCDGIGRQIAEQMAREGARTAVVDYNADTGKAAEELRDQYEDALFVKANAASYEDMCNVRTETFEKFDRVDILVLDAGVDQREKVNEISIYRTGRESLILIWPAYLQR